MAYFKIDGYDYSDCVSGLKVASEHQYNAQTNAAGNMVVDYINKKRTITVSMIALDDTKMARLQEDLDKFQVSLSYRDLRTNELVDDVICIVPINEIEYYTIQAGKVMYNAFELEFIEM